jgi:hypothetical protein
MSISCPNKRLKSWKDLVQKVGENKAYLLWSEYNGNVPDNYYNEKSIEVEETQDNDIITNEKNLSEFVDESVKTSIFDENTLNFKKKTLLDLNKKLLFGKGTLDKSYTSKEVLQNIIDSNLNFKDETIDLIFKAMTLLERSNSRVKVISQERFDKMTKDSDGDGVAIMAYNYELESVIYLPESSLANFRSDDVISSFLHEIAHELSINALINPITYAEKQFAELVTKAFEQYKYLGERNFSKSYGFTNVKEFVAELYSNKEFQQEIISLDKSLWQKFKDAFRRILGLPKTLANEELIDSILLIQEVEKYIEQVGTTYTYKNDYSNSFGNVLFKKVDSKNIKLDTLEKKLQYTIDLSKDRIEQLIDRTRSNKKSKSKKDKEEFLKSFESLLNEIKVLENTDKWKAIVSYVNSFSKTLERSNNILDSLLYDEKTDTFTKEIDSEKMLEVVYAHEEYVAAYDLLENIQTLIKDSQNDITVNSDVRAQTTEIKSILRNLQESHDKIEGTFNNVRKAYAVKLFSKPENNTRVVTEWRDKLFAEYSKLKIQNETREQYFGRMINGKYKEEYQQALKDSAKSIVNDPTFDISSFSLHGEDLLNTNSSLINIMSNIIGKVRDNIIQKYKDKEFELLPLFEKFVKAKGQGSQSKMYGNLLELSKSKDSYYLKGEYSIDFLDAVNNELYPILDKITELKEKLYDETLTKAKNNRLLKSNPEYKELSKQRREWFSKHTIQSFGPNGQSLTQPNPKYKNKELTGVEKETLDYFRKQTIENDKDIYDGKVSLISKLYGAEFYKLPAVTKNDLERTLEGDIKGQFTDKFKDLTQIRVDDIGYEEEVNSKNEELRRVRIHYRGKISSKDQSLDLFTIYRKEAHNAINYGEKKSNEVKLKLFLDIARQKEYKKRSKNTGKWLQNKYAENQPGVTVKDGLSNEYKKIKGLLETHLYDILSYNGGKAFGTNIEANKLSSMANGAAASIGMTMNIGSGVVNVMNGSFQMMIDATGGNLFSLKDYTSAEANYFNPKNQMATLADLGNPVKTSFHNQMLDMFDIMGGFDNATQEFIRNNMAKRLISKKSMNGLNEMGEHMMNTVLTESILRGRKVMNKNREFIDKEGNVVSKDKAASLFDMLSLDKNGKLVMSDKVVYTDKNLDSKYHEGGKQHINYLIKKKGHDIFGVYDSLMKAELAKHWWGKTLLMFKNFFLSGFKYRYKGMETSLKSKDELTDEDITYNNAEQEFTEGIYTSFVRFIKQGVIPNLKGLQLAHMKEYYNDLSDHEKANLKKTTLEITLTSVMLPLLGALLGALGGDDDDNVYFWMYAFRRLESELSQFRDPRELNRMIQNPVAANRFIQNSITFASDLITPINFFPEDNERYFDYLSKNKKDKYIMWEHGKKVIPVFAQSDKSYKQLHGLFDK